MAHCEWFLVGKKSGSWIYISFPQRVLLSLARQMEEGATFINIEELHKKSGALPGLTSIWEPYGHSSGVPGLP